MVQNWTAWYRANAGPGLPHYGMYAGMLSLYVISIMMKVYISGFVIL